MNRNVFDLFTIAHFAVGLIMGAQGVPRALAYAVIVGTEIAEVGLRGPFPAFFEESVQNIIADLATSAGGYELARGL